MIAEEKMLIENNCLSKDKVLFMFSLFETLMKLKNNKNIDDVYIYQGIDKIEIYVFDYKEDFETEDFVTETLVKWEQSQGYFPEVFINLSDNKMNLLPRKAIKIC